MARSPQPPRGKAPKQEQFWIEKRTYHVETTVQDYLSSREVTAEGRFLRQMLGDEFWGTFQGRVETSFAERFPQRFNDFREAVLIVGHKP